MLFQYFKGIFTDLTVASIVKSKANPGIIIKCPNWINELRYILHLRSRGSAYSRNRFWWWCWRVFRFRGGAYSKTDSEDGVGVACTLGRDSSKQTEDGVEDGIG